MKHEESHHLAGQTVLVDIKGHPQMYSGLKEFRVQDWWDLLTGGSWMMAEGNPAALIYSMRAALTRLPLDDEVVYGKVGSFGHLVHVSEIVAHPAPEPAP